ncbi:MAG: hypothetical protein IJX39_07405 [Clostridia bacterium]|nr:hypothetical protein [Clostridia bacterium]
MFYDERIENVKGKISRNSIFISFIVSLVLGGIHFANISRNAPDNKYFWFVSLELAAFIGALLSLTIGFIICKPRIKDERTESEQNSFYNKAASILIKFVLGVFAFVMPIALYIGSTTFNFADGGFDDIIYILLFVVGIYVVYSFKRNDIYFNYSIIDSDRYYKGVFKNIGKLALYALAFLGISAISFVGLVATKTPDSALITKILLQTVAYYIGTFTELALLYLLYSFLEKSSYNSENSMSKSTIISLGITIFIYAVYTASVIFVDAQPISQTSAMQIVSIISSFDIYIKFALLIFLTYFGYEYQRVRKNTLLSAACIIILLSETLSVFIGQISGSLIFVFMPEIMSQDAYIINQLFSTINVSIEDASSLANIVGFVLIIFALVKDKLIHKAHRFAVGAFAVLGGIELFLRTQVDVLQVSIYHFLVEIIELCYFAILVACVAKRTKKELQYACYP